MQNVFRDILILENFSFDKKLFEKIDALPEMMASIFFPKQNAHLFFHGSDILKANMHRLKATQLQF